MRRRLARGLEQSRERGLAGVASARASCEVTSVESTVTNARGGTRGRRGVERSERDGETGGGGERENERNERTREKQVGKGQWETRNVSSRQARSRRSVRSSVCRAARRLAYIYCSSFPVSFFLPSVHRARGCSASLFFSHSLLSHSLSLHPFGLPLSLSFSLSIALSLSHSLAPVGRAHHRSNARSVLFANVRTLRRTCVRACVRESARARACVHGGVFVAHRCHHRRVFKRGGG